MSELEIPERAVIRAYDGAHLIEEALRLAAPIIVAAKLRQLADFYTASWPAHVRMQLLNEADELDPEGATR